MDIETIQEAEVKNLIQWPRAKYWDKAWNPIIGCKPCSPACENCYAAAMMRRFGAADFSPRPTTRVNPPRKGVVFCGNMTDLFGEWVPYPHNNIGYVNAAVGSDTTCLWLTKRVANMCDALTSFEFADISNHYFGFTAENQEWYDRRFRESRQLPDWANWWISAEPLLGPIDLDFCDRHPVTGAFGVIPHLPSWLVVGCESGPKRRPCKIEWVESIVEQCRTAGVPVFVKQLDIGGRCVTDINKFPAHLRIRQVPWATKGENK